MTYNHIILYSFLSLVAVILLSAYLLKIYRGGKKKKHHHDGHKSRKINFSLKGDLMELNKLALLLEDLERYHIPIKIILELNIIIEEVFTGIVNHLKEDTKEAVAFISIHLEKDEIVAIIRDKNEEFNPTLIPAIDLNAPIEEISFQGLGFHMIKHLADNLIYQRLDGFNILTIHKAYSA